MSRYSRYQVIHYPQPKVYKPLKVMMKLIVWDTPTSISLKLPHRGTTLDIEYNYLKERNVFKVPKANSWIGEQDGFNESRFGEALMHLLIGKYGYAIKQIKYEILDYGDAPKNAVAA